jgi:hypothetical protein
VPQQPFEFFAFRATVHPSRREPLLGRVSSEAKRIILRDAVLEQPSAPWGPTTWHIGNATTLDDWGLYFRLGRERMMSVPQTDSNGNFIDREASVSPYTHAVLDVRLGVCAVARRSSLTTDAERLARQLSRVLTASSVARSKFVDIEAATLKEPGEFLARLRQAYSVHVLWVVNRRPNPFDVEEEFVRPTERLLENLNADNARTEWKGERLKIDDSGAADIVRSTAATGGDAGARIQEREDSPATTRISLSDDRARFQEEIDSEEFRSGAERILDRMRKLYREIWPGE